MTFSASKECIGKFLRSVDTNENEGYIGSGDAVGISSLTIKQLKWPIEPQKNYEIFHGATSDTIGFVIVVDSHATPEPVVYMTGVSL